MANGFTKKHKLPAAHTHTYTHRREPAMYYTHRLFTRSFSHHLMINMPLSNACSSATQCLQSQLVLFFFCFCLFLSSLIYPFSTDLSLYSSSHPSLMTLSGRIMNPLPCFCPLHSSSMAAAHLHFLCCCLRKEINFKESNTGSQILYLCSSDWMSLEPSWADLETLLYLCLLYSTLSPALYSLNGLFISKPRK